MDDYRVWLFQAWRPEDLTTDGEGSSVQPKIANFILAVACV